MIKRCKVLLKYYNLKFRLKIDEAEKHINTLLPSWNYFRVCEKKWRSVIQMY